MKRINCLLVDDEPLAQQVLEQHIAATEELTLVGKCFNAIEAFSLFHQQPVDLLFLDIKMPGLNGTDFIQSLKNPPAFIFTTAYSEFALLSYDLDAVDYLLKPITYERFKIAVDKYLNRKPAQPAPVQEKDYFYIRADGNLVRLFYRDLLYAEAMKDYIRVVTAGGQHLTHMTMKSLLELLPSHQFKRIHRSYIVNTHHISIAGRNFINIGKAKLPVSDNYRNNISLI